jgi:fimbrial chaperone protein
MLTSLLLSLLFAAPGLSFRLEPMVLSLSLTKPQASGTFAVENNTKQKIAVEFRMKKRLIDENGKEERPDASGFLVFPEQMALEPGEKRNVRVTWMGEALPSREEAYRLVATQLPVDFSPGAATKGAQLKFLLEYVASLYLVPPGTKPKMKVLKQAVSKEGMLEVLVANEGSAHFLLDRMEILFRSGKKEGKPDAKVLQELRTENLLPGNQRWLRMPLPKGFSDPQVSVVFEP